jgi:5-methylcytosine-specific restriction endonuclease McrA
MSKKGARIRMSTTDKEMIARNQGQLGIMGIICKGCGRSFPMDIMEVDHIKPISKGGKDQPSNLQLLCPPCNKKKGKKRLDNSKKKSSPIGLELGRQQNIFKNTKFF